MIADSPDLAAPVEPTFDPHVVVALTLLLVAIVIVFLLIAALHDEKTGKK